MKNNYCNIMDRRQPDNITGPAHMYHQLKAQDFTAVRHLCDGIKLHLQLKKYQFSISVEDLEELANDAAVLVLRKICDDTFIFYGISPMTYAQTVADNLLHNFCRKKRMECLELSESMEPYQQPEVEAYFAQKELKNRIENALLKLSEANQMVIRLKYLEDFSDEEIVRFELSPHRTTDSLKSARCRSMKRLAGLMKEK